MGMNKRQDKTRENGVTPTKVFGTFCMNTPWAAIPWALISY